VVLGLALLGLLESVGVGLDLDDLGLVDESIDHGDDACRAREDLAPFEDDLVCRHDDRFLPVAPVDDLEDEIAVASGSGEVAHFVDDEDLPVRVVPELSRESRSVVVRRQIVEKLARGDEARSMSSVLAGSPGMRGSWSARVGWSRESEPARSLRSRGASASDLSRDSPLSTIRFSLAPGLPKISIGNYYWSTIVARSKLCLCGIDPRRSFRGSKTRAPGGRGCLRDRVLPAIPNRERENEKESTMKCPRCETVVLDERDRDGLTIDVCGKCRGIWLDRGELEKLIAREADDEEQRARNRWRGIDREDDDDDYDDRGRPESRSAVPRGDFGDDRRDEGSGPDARPRKRRWYESLTELFD
jgi:Zn-finger nucleic acid-binding protein